MMDDQDGQAGLAAANRFFDGLLSGDLAALQAACAPGSILWINLTEQERALEDSLRGFAALRSRVPDLRMENVRRRGIPGGFLEQHVLMGTLPDGEPLRVVGCFVVCCDRARSVGATPAGRPVGWFIAVRVLVEEAALILSRRRAVLVLNEGMYRKAGASSTGAAFAFAD